MNVFRLGSTSGEHPTELMHGRYVDHAFPRHYHESYVVQVAVEGANECELRGVARVIEPGDVLFLHPGEVHTGRSADGGPIEYRAFYPSAELMGKLSPDGIAPRFARHIVRDPVLASILQTAHRKFMDEESPDSPFEVEEALGQAILRHGLFDEASRCRPEPMSDWRRAVGRVRRAVTADPGRNWSLEELARLSAYSPFTLTRIFVRTVGMPPIEFIHAFRAERAKQLLRRGHRSWEVAAILGFADQAHFTRMFRRIVGTTPGVFRSACGAER